VLKFDDMEVGNGPMDLDFTHEFLLGSTLNEGLLANDFGCHYWCALRRVQCLEFITLGKTTLAQKFALEITPDLDFSIILGNFFLDYCVDRCLIVLRLRAGTRNLLLRLCSCILVVSIHVH